MGTQSKDMEFGVEGLLPWRCQDTGNKYAFSRLAKREGQPREEEANVQ